MRRCWEELACPPPSLALLRLNKAGAIPAGGGRGFVYYYVSTSKRVDEPVRMGGECKNVYFIRATRTCTYYSGTQRLGHMGGVHE